MRSWVAFAFAVLLPALSAIRAQAPTGEPFTVVAADAQVEKAAIDRVAAEARIGLAGLAPWFPGLPKRPFRIHVHAGAAELPAELTAVHHPGSPGFAFPGRDELHLLMREARSEAQGLGIVVTHEIVHVLLGQMTEPNVEKLPRWAHEGLAQVLSGETYLGASEQSLIWRVKTDQLIPFSSLERDFPRDPVLLRVAYAQSFSLIAWLERELGRKKLLSLVGEIDRDTSFLRAVVLAMQRTSAELESDWHDYLLYASGAQYRSLLENCFSLLMILALPLLAMAVARRFRNEDALRRRMEAEERLRPAPMLPDPPYDPPIDDVPEDEDLDDPGAADAGEGAQSPDPDRDRR